MKHDSIIFDLDGTLWDTCEGCATTWNQVLRAENIDYRQITTQDMKSIMGKTQAEIQSMFFASLDHATADALMNKIFQQQTQVLKTGGWKLYDGVAGGLQALAQRYPLYIVSNCYEGYLQTFNFCTHLVDKTIQDYEYIGRTGQSKGKNIKTIMQRNQLQNPIYIGDTKGDQDAAAHAKINFGFAAYGFGESTQHNYIFSNFIEITQTFNL